MEVKKKQKLTSSALGMVILLMLCSLMASPALGCSSKGGGGNNKGCKDCLVEQMKYGCPRCVPLLHCMARCMWGGASRSRCIDRCDCNGGKPSLSDCKRCMSRCKCSCVA